MMYYLVVATLMLAFPVLSVAVEVAHFSTGVNSALIGKWFVFWSNPPNPGRSCASSGSAIWCWESSESSACGCHRGSLPSHSQED
jgi:hypothetical protein